jgi:hypothetical protein
MHANVGIYCRCSHSPAIYERSVELCKVVAVAHSLSIKQQLYFCDIHVYKNFLKCVSHMTYLHQHNCNIAGLNHKFCYGKFNRFVFIMTKHVTSDNNKFTAYKNRKLCYECIVVIHLSRHYHSPNQSPIPASTQTKVQIHWRLEEAH